MRFNFYLRGCGLGILLATIVLSVSFAGKINREPSDEDVIARAKELGMEFADEKENEAGSTEKQDTDSKNTQPEKVDKTSQKTESQKGSQTEDSPKNNVQEEDSQADASQVEEPQLQNEDSQTAGDTPEAPQTVVIQVRAGEVCRELAEDLYNNGIVPDAEEFREYMKTTGYDSLIRVGEYEMTPGMEYLEIAKMLTTK